MSETIDGHVWVTDERKSRRFRDVRVIRCERCLRTVRTCMRSMKPLAEKLPKNLLPCTGEPEWVTTMCRQAIEEGLAPGLVGALRGFLTIGADAMHEIEGDWTKVRTTVRLIPLRLEQRGAPPELVASIRARLDKVLDGKPLE